MSPHGLLNPITTNHRSTTNVSQESNHRTHRVPYPSTVWARSTDPLIQLARISCRHGQHDIRSVDYYCSNRGSNELTSPLRNRDLRRLAICQNRVWLWDLFPKRSRTISPTVFRFAMLAFSIHARPVLFPPGRGSKRMERCLSRLLKKRVTRLYVRIIWAGATV